MPLLVITKAIGAAALLYAGALVIGSVAVVAGREVKGQVEALVQAMTLEEKVTLLHGAEDPAERAEVGYVPGVSRLGIPPLCVTDDRAGRRAGTPQTIVPSRIAVGASFDPSLARRIGRLRGREGRARGQNVHLGPNANVLRVPQAGQSPELLGEDPFHIGCLVAEEVKGIQEEGMIATVRHFLVHNFKTDRNRVSVEVGDRALREIYMPGFRRAIEVGVGSIVGAPNRVNGTYACDHEGLLTDVLRDEFDYSGWVMSGWFARHSLEALQAGLDQEMPGVGGMGAPQAVYFGEPLQTAVEFGRVSEKHVDRSVRRILRQMKQAGLLDSQQVHHPTVSSEEDADLAFEGAVSGAVLLQNDDNTLPLSKTEEMSVAVIGPAAQQFPSMGRDDRAGISPAAGSPVEALRRRLGTEVEVDYEPGIDPDGVPVPCSALSPSESLSVQGLRRTTADGTVEIDPEVDFTGADALPSASQWTWSGTLTAPETGTYRFKLQTNGGWGRFSLDGDVLASTGGDREGSGPYPRACGGYEAAADLKLEKGETRSISIQVECYGDTPGVSNGEPLQVRFGWIPPNRRQRLLGRAVAAAEEADATVVFGVTPPLQETDRTSLSLPASQDTLIRAVAEEGTSTAVVLYTGGPVVMPWLEEVESVLEMWNPGQEGGEATAALLAGDITPGGRLPVTFPRRVEDLPTHPSERYPGTNRRAHYTEGVFVGYRWYDQNDISPLFPFGHGCTYTTFTYSDLSVRSFQGHREVRFRVRNTGERTGSAVPQVYLGRPGDPPVSMPPKELVGFDRLELSPGETATVTIPLDHRAFSYWSEAEDRWCVAGGRRPVYVGASSRDIRLETAFFVD